MSRIYVNFSGLNNIGDRCKSSALKIESIQLDFQYTVRQLDWDLRFESDIEKKALQLSDKLEEYSCVLKKYKNFIDISYNKYIELESYGNKSIKSDNTKTKQNFLNEFWINYGWNGLLSGTGYIKTIFDLYNEIKNGKSWRDLAGAGINIYQFLSGAAETYNRYKRIGNAVGTKTAMCWWAKNIIGLKPLGRASSAKNIITRFSNNITNKTSPFNTQFKNILSDFKGVNGVGKAVASWGSVFVNGILNWSNNKDEQAESNSEMSDGRVIAETITETVVDTTMAYGAGIIVGAAITTTLGTVAAPGVVVVAASGAVIAGLNTGVEFFTGQTMTEWISDTILDTGETIGSAIGNITKNASFSVGAWFEKLL